MDAVKSIFDDLNIRIEAEKEIGRMYNEAKLMLHNINVDSERLKLLETFTARLMQREQ